MTDQQSQTKCVGMFYQHPGQFHSSIHADCFGCKRKQVRHTSSHHGFFQSPAALFKNGKCEAKRHE